MLFPSVRLAGELGADRLLARHRLGRHHILEIRGLRDPADFDVLAIGEAGNALGPLDGFLKVTMAPSLEPVRPSAASRMPASASDWLYLPISSNISGAGAAFSPSGVILTITMKRISFLL
jgi:hypothetical protein